MFWLIVMYYFMVLYLKFLSMCGTESMGENVVSGLERMRYMCCMSICVCHWKPLFCLILIYFKIQMYIHLLMIWKFSVRSCNTYILSLVCFVSTSFSKQYQIKGEAWDSRCDQKYILINPFFNVIWLTGHHRDTHYILMIVHVYLYRYYLV